jgi:hypothetical protein
MQNNKSALLLALALPTAVLSCFLPLVSVHTYCENRAGAGVLVAVAVAIAYVRIRSSASGPVPRVLSILTYLGCALAITVNSLFIAFASRVCPDKFGWLWLPVILVCYGWLLLSAWLKWLAQSPRFPAPLLRSRAVFLGLLFGTLSALLFAGFWSYTHNFGYITALTLSLAAFFYFSLGLAFLGFLLGFAGRGFLRVSVIIISAVMVLVWWVIFAIGAMY